MDTCRNLLKFLLFVIFTSLPGVAFSSYSLWFETPSEAQSECNSAYQAYFSNPSYTCSFLGSQSDSSMCNSGSGGALISRWNFGYPVGQQATYHACKYGYKPCPDDGQVRNSAGECEAPPPPPCEFGTKKILTEFQPTGGAIVYIGGGGPDLSDAGCRYECSSSGGDGSYFYDDTGTYHDYLCTSTGDVSQESDVFSSTVPADAKYRDGSSNSDGQTCSTVGSSTVCVGGDLPENCMTVNGVKTCQSEASADEAVIDNEPVSKSDDKNCVKGSNGEIVCVSDESDSEFCGTVNGVKTCFSKSFAQSTDTKTIEILPDGTTVETQSTTTNIVNDVNDGTTVTTTAPDGTVTTQRTGGDNTALQDIAKAAEKSECEKNPNTLGCIGIDDGEIPGADDIQTIDVPISLDYTSWGEAGTCPAGESFDIGGVAQVFSYQPVCDLATGIRPVVIATAFIAAALIVFGGVKD